MGIAIITEQRVWNSFTIRDAIPSGLRSKSKRKDKWKKELVKMIRKVLLVIAMIISVFYLVSCQTAQGLGEDIQSLGEKISEAAE
jgi:predicted small secreted protein